jgi:hypothetical protein
MKKLNLSLQGLFGNQLFQYAFAKAYAERHGFELCCHWPQGEQVFQLNHSPAAEGLPRIPENDLLAVAPNHDFEARGYFQQQAALIYSRRELRHWFTFRPEVLTLLDTIPQPSAYYAHRRIGDYAGYGYVVVSRPSYERAMVSHGYNPADFVFLNGHGYVTPEEDKSSVPGLPAELGFLRDFYCMMRARVLFRSNSSFAWWASVLGNAETFSPVIDGLEGGSEREVDFVPGNWPRFANLSFVTDLHLSA